MELSNFHISEEPVKFYPTDPSTGEKIKSVVFDVVGQDSKRFKTVDRKINDKRLKNAQRMMRGKVKLTTAELEEETMQRTAACIVGWKGLTVEGKDFPYSAQNVIKILQEAPDLYDQIREFVETRENFMQNA